MAKRLTFIYSDGTTAVWKADTASWGHDSRNVVAYRAKLIKMGRADADNPREVGMALLPLADVRSMFEEDW